MVKDVCGASRRTVLRAAAAAAASLVLGAAVLCAAPRAGGAAAAQTSADGFIRGLADQAIQALTQPNLTPAERDRRARDLLRQNFAIATIGQFVLGRFWRVATPEEQREYLALFEDLIIATYVDRFARYSGERLEVKQAVPIEQSRDIIVYSQIVRPTGDPVEVGWRVRPQEGSFKIVDVTVEGVSMGQTQRSEFSAIVQNNGGKVSALIDEMRKRLQSRA